MLGPLLSQSGKFLSSTPSARLEPRGSLVATSLVSTLTFRKTVEYYQAIFQSFGSRGSALTVVPFNQASKQDVEALIDYIYNNLNVDLDYIMPFAGIP